MDEGRIRGTEEIWPADQIWQLGDASLIDWCCIGCEAVLTPSAWRPDAGHKRSAHFAARHGHEPDCTADGLEKLIASGGKKSIKTEDGLPGPYPAAIRFVERRERAASEGQPVEGVRDVYRHARSDGDGRPRNPDHRRTVTTIRQICRFYQAFTQLRHLALDIPEGDGNTYYDLFQPMSNEYNGPVDGKILYAGIRFKEVPDYTAQILRIMLNCANFATINGETIKSPFILMIDWRGWSPTQRGLFRNHYEEVRQELAEKYKAAKDKKNLPSANIYFIGSRVGANEFLADDHRKICVLGA